MTAEWRIRRLEPEDSLEELTALLHRAYAPLADAGMRFLATHQEVSTTAERVAHGECFVAVVGSRIVGTIMLRHGRPSSSAHTYAQPATMIFGQFGIEPAFKGRGIGRALHDHVAVRAASLGALVLACDTAEPATELIAMYRRWGYEIVERISWDETNYVSVVLARSLDAVLEEPA